MPITSDAVPLVRLMFLRKNQMETKQLLCFFSSKFSNMEVILTENWKSNKRSKKKRLFRKIATFLGWYIFQLHHGDGCKQRCLDSSCSQYPLQVLVYSLNHLRIFHLIEIRASPSFYLCWSSPPGLQRHMICQHG